MRQSPSECPWKGTRIQRNKAKSTTEPATWDMSCARSRTPPIRSPVDSELSQTVSVVALRSQIGTLQTAAL